MASSVVVGTQWGDEGKGKITDYLSQEADMVVRFQGGNNAGHTIEFGGNKYALHLIPSGVFNKNTINVMAAGMVINPKAFLEEIKMLKDNGIDTSNIYISDRAHITMPYHIREDMLQEQMRGKKKVGTTKKGIGPTYADKINRTGIRVAEFIDENLFSERLKINVLDNNKIFTLFDIETFDYKAIYNEYIEYAKEIKKYVTDTSLLVHNAYNEGKKVLFEGAQGVMLDINHGTYPYVTSSSPSASSVPINVGISPRMLDNIFGVTKAYSTRVGEGAFPTEFEDKTAQQIREVGREYGTTTGRARRIGWFDGVVVKYSARVSGITGLAVCLLDVLTGLDELKICTKYVLNGQEYDNVPALITDFEKCEPVYETLPSWNEDITKVSSYDELPIEAKNYIRKIEEVTGVKVSIVSVGPDRTQTIIRENLF